MNNNLLRNLNIKIKKNPMNLKLRKIKKLVKLITKNVKHKKMEKNLN